jgi:hypothetical protein
MSNVTTGEAAQKSHESEPDKVENDEDSFLEKLFRRRKKNFFLFFLLSNPSNDLHLIFQEVFSTFTKKIRVKYFKMRRPATRVARFFWVQSTKNRKIYPAAATFPKYPQNLYKHKCFCRSSCCLTTTTKVTCDNQIWLFVLCQESRHLQAGAGCSDTPYR